MSKINYNEEMRRVAESHPPIPDDIRKRMDEDRRNAELDREFLLGVTAGWNAAHCTDEAPEKRLERIKNSRRQKFSKD